MPDAWTIGQTRMVIDRLERNEIAFQPVEYITVALNAAVLTD